MDVILQTDKIPPDLAEFFEPIDDKTPLTNTWIVNPSPYANAHFATWPPKLVEPMIKASTRPGDTVLDPFAGSGTTLMVANKLGRRAIGVDLSTTYLMSLVPERMDEVSTEPKRLNGHAADYADSPLFAGVDE